MREKAQNSGSNRDSRDFLCSEKAKGCAARLKPSVRPFLRWAGSKRLLLDHIAPLLPSSFGTYFEPFLGSGAMYFLLRPQNAVLSDKSKDLINTFRSISQNDYAVIRYLSLMPTDRRSYYKARKAKPRGKHQRAAWFIYLNRLCWNGLYRVNSKGQFNVPYAGPAKRGLIDLENLEMCAKLLRELTPELRTGDFMFGLEGAERGDLVYLDPPYVTTHNNNGFVDYNEVLFSWQDQIRLAEKAQELVRKRVKVVVSNADHFELDKLYRGFDKQVIRRSSTIAGLSEARSVITEVVYHSV